MYVSAQRVMSPMTGQRGVNIFVYSHGCVWDGPVPVELLPEVNPGALVWRDIQLPPPGNRILSYLDVVAPDDFPREELCNRLAVLKQALPNHGNPTILTWDPVWFRFGLGYVALPWTTELGALAGHLVLRLPVAL